MGLRLVRQFHQGRTSPDVRSQASLTLGLIYMAFSLAVNRVIFAMSRPSSPMYGIVSCISFEADQQFILVALSTLTVLKKRA